MDVYIVYAFLSQMSRLFDTVCTICDATIYSQVV